MLRKITFTTNIIVFFLYCFVSANESDLTIIPQIKPIINEKINQEKISKNIIKPKKKPLLQNEIDSDLAKELDAEKKEKILPEVKPKKIKKVYKIDGIIVPKSNPLIAKKQINVIKQKSKYYRKREFKSIKKT